MTTSAGLPAVRESLHLALLVDPAGAAVAEVAEAAAEHYALNYSRHPPATLFAEVRSTRRLLTDALARSENAGPYVTDLRRSVGRLSALMGNLAFHLDDATGARAHLTAAITYGTHCGDARLTAWAHGAQSMVAASRGAYERALTHAEHGLALAPAGLLRAQLHAWAQLPALAALERAREADSALAAAARELDIDPVGEAPGRFGFDAAEYTLLAAEAHLVLGRTDRAAALAGASAADCPTGTPGWAAATLVLALAEAATEPGQAAQRAHDVLDRVPTARLRSTARARLHRLDTAIDTVTGSSAAGLRERLRALPPPVDHHGAATA